jgi:uncharacterized damage-inducible protein DinB
MIWPPSSGVGVKDLPMSGIIRRIGEEFQRTKAQAERAWTALDDEAFFHRPSAECNPVALIVKHMGGNLKSRWTDFLSSDGEKASRDRDGEFLLEQADTRESIQGAWNQGWETLFATLETLSDADLSRTVTIRGEALEVHQALLRSLAHAAYHNGQILYLARLIRPERSWLTIAPGESRQHRGAYLGTGESARKA